MLTCRKHFPMTLAIDIDSKDFFNLGCTTAVKCPEPHTLRSRAFCEVCLSRIGSCFLSAFKLPGLVSRFVCFDQSLELGYGTSSCNGSI